MDGRQDTESGLIGELIRLESERGERLVSTIRALMHSVTVIVGSIAMFVVDIGEPWRRLQTASLVSAPFILAIVWGWTWFVWSRPYRRAYGFVSVGGDVLTLAAAMAVTSIAGGDEAATINALGAGPPLLGLFFVLAGAGVRQDASLCVFGGVLAIVGFGAAVAIARSHASSMLLDPGVGLLASPLVWIGRGAIVGFTAALVALAARNGRRVAAAAGAAMDEQARLVQVFGRYVDAGVARNALSGDLEAETREVTVLFTDLRDFTTVAEQLEPAETLAILNAHYGALVPVVHEYGGVVNKFIGDAIMATFGVVDSERDHASRAVRAGVAMLQAQDLLNRRLHAEGRRELSMAVGIATGPVVVGSLGAADRVEYAVIGDTVNTAARLESLNKQLGTRILFSEATQRAVGDELAVRAMGEHSLKGKVRPVEVFTIDV